VNTVSHFVQEVAHSDLRTQAAYAALALSLWNARTQRRDRRRDIETDERAQAGLVSGWIEQDDVDRTTLFVQNNSEQPIYDFIVVPRTFYFASNDKTGLDACDPIFLPVFPPKTLREFAVEQNGEPTDIQARPHLSFRAARDMCWLRDMHGRLWSYERDHPFIVGPEGHSFWDVFVDRVPGWLNWLGPRPVPRWLSTPLYMTEQYRRDSGYQDKVGISRRRADDLR
jgi:hypothetical protein